MIRIEKNCLNCGAELKGRTDMKYCDLKCKSAHRYKTSKLRPERFFDKVDFQLRWNRKLLKTQFDKGNTLFDSKEIRDKGFDVKYFTHFWRNKHGDTYFFSYEYGYSKRIENHIELYHLITHKDCEESPRLS